MNTIIKRVSSLFLVLALVLSFSVQAQATTESPVLTQELIEESTADKLSADLLIVPTAEGLVVDEEKPESQQEPELKPDYKADEVTLGASEQETPANGPTITPLAATAADLGSNWVLHYDDSKATQVGANDSKLFDYLLDFTIERTEGPERRGKMSYICGYDIDKEVLFSGGTVEETSHFFTASDFSNYDFTKGQLSIQIKSYDLDERGEDIVTIKINIDYIESTISAHAPTNPTTISGSSAYTNPNNIVNNGNILQTWEITGPNSYSKTVSGADINSLLVYDQSDTNYLKAGTYTVTLAGAGKTVNGTVVPDDYIKGAITTFNVVYLIPTVAIDKAVNPTSIVVARDGAYSPDSTYAWQVYKWDGTIETPVSRLSGTGTTADTNSALDLPTIKDLAAGSYRVRIVETDTTNSVVKGETFGDFTIVDPLVTPALVGGFTTSPASVALPANPTSGTGTPKFTDSTVTWEILDKNGNSLGTPVIGASATDPEAAFKLLPEAEYKLQYTETATYNGRKHSDNVPFQIINPLTSSAVDNPTNPTLGTGTQKMPAGESVVTWEILDNNNQVVGNGTGLTVPKTEFDKLTNGDYKLKFTETSGYNQAVHSHEVPFKMDVAVPIAKGTLEVKHIFLDSKGNVVTSPATITKNYTENVGTAYSTTALATLEIPAGYRLVKGRLPANATGQYVATHTVVEYYYEPIPVVQPGQGTVTVVHTIAHTDGSVTVVETEDPIVDEIGKPYATKPIAIPGYILKEVPSNGGGTIAEGNQTVTYVYVPDPTQAQLVEKHLIVDGAGNVIGEVKAPVVTVGADGTPYSTTAKAPAGYKLVTSRAPVNANGTYKTGTEQVVSYYYTKTLDPVTPNPGGNTSGGSGGWRPNGWTNPNADKSPNTAKLTGSSALTSEAEAGISPENGDNLSVGGNKENNPQTGDSTNQASILNILYIVLFGALAVFILSVILPRRKRKR